MALGCNFMSLGRDRVIVPRSSQSLIGQLKARGFEVAEVDMSEISKTGGGIHCMAQSLRREAGAITSAQAPDKEATVSAIASDAVRPGDSMPNRLTRPGCGASGTVDPKIGRRLVRGVHLGPDSRVIGLEPRALERRIVAPDRGRELLRAARIEAVVDVSDPFDVRTETYVSRQIECRMNAEAMGVRYRINEPPERRHATQRIVAAARESGARNRVRCKPGDAPRHGRRLETGGVDELSGR